MPAIEERLLGLAVVCVIFLLLMVVEGRLFCCCSSGCCCDGLVIVPPLLQFLVIGGSLRDPIEFIDERRSVFFCGEQGDSSQAERPLLLFKESLRFVFFRRGDETIPTSRAFNSLDTGPSATEIELLPRCR